MFGVDSRYPFASLELARLSPEWETVREKTVEDIRLRSFERKHDLPRGGAHIQGGYIIAANIRERIPMTLQVTIREE